MTPKLKPNAEDLMNDLVNKHLEGILSASDISCNNYWIKQEAMVAGAKLALANLPKLLEATHRGTGVDLIEYCDGKSVAIVEVE